MSLAAGFQLALVEVGSFDRSPPSSSVDYSFKPASARPATPPLQVPPSVASASVFFSVSSSLWLSTQLLDEWCFKSRNVVWQ